MKNCLVVLGMHRSGTSAFTGMLERLGVDLGNNLMAAKPDNPGGFFENNFVVDTNDAIFKALGASWDSPFQLPSLWQTDFNDDALKRASQDFLDREIARDKLYALKDPRLSRLLPYWQPLFLDKEIQAHYVILVRNPLDIVRSLAERNGFSERYSLLLWMHHMLEAERHTRTGSRAFLHYDDLLQDPELALRKVYRHCDLAFPEDKAGALDGFIDAGKRHHATANEEVGERCPPLVTDLYTTLCELSRQENNSAGGPSGTDDIAAAFAAGEALFHPPELMREVRERRSLPENLPDFLRSPPWRLYRAYQNAVEKMMPEGTLVRTLLQRIKGWFSPGPR